MDCVIYEKGSAAGTLTMASEGLFWNLHCKIKPSKELYRLYAVSGLSSVYLGIPDSRGELRVRIAKKHLPEMQAALAVTTPKGDWLPWRGVVDGVEVELCYCRQEADGISLALPEAELIKFPAWAGKWNRERVYGQDLALLRLDEDGHLPQIEREHGGTEEYETEHETMDGGYVDPLLLADLPADYSYGGTGEEAGGDYL
jgi:hypothetical protein